MNTEITKVCNELIEEEGEQLDTASHTATALFPLLLERRLVWRLCWSLCEWFCLAEWRIVMLIFEEGCDEHEAADRLGLPVEDVIRSLDDIRALITQAVRSTIRTTEMEEAECTRAMTDGMA